MIYHVTTTTANPGKYVQMGEWAEKISAMVKENYGTELTMLHNVVGSGDEW